MTNWRQEAERFAPGLRTLVLHGLERKQHFEKVLEHDLIITSYPLLPRDQEFLLQQKFHCVILDEAQYIKNPKTTYAQIANASWWKGSSTRSAARTSGSPPRISMCSSPRCSEAGTGLCYSFTGST